MMHSTQNSGWQVLVANRKALVSCLLGLFFIALVADLRADGVGHGQTLFKRDTTTSDTAIWQPAAGVKWQIQLIDAVEDTTVDADIWDIDLFDNTAETITTLKNKGHKVICYFSAGTYEDWRSDVSKFDTADFGSNLDEWPGERWLNIKSTSVRSIMSARLDLAKEKGCDGVDPDNIDAYGNENGLSLTEADSIDFLTFLASESHSRGMSIGLKNGGDIIGSVIDKMQWSVNEQCAEYNECDVYAAFTEVNKPVFHIEYSDETIESSSSDSGSASSTTDEDSDASTTTSVASATATATSDTETEDEDDATDGAVKAIDSTTTTASSAQVSATASSFSGVASKTSTSSAATATSSDSATEDSTDDVDDEDEDNDEDEDEDDDDEEDAEDAEDAEDEADDDEDDKEDDEETTDVKPKHRYGHGHHKLRARATLSVSLKNTACNAASADKFSTVIKNMNLDAWVEYC
ncbi:CAZyme family [Penicillium brevicompactum]|uniref:alpha-galactosidase n=1 Tax=Penicillium brevicompactum TaxID=5074 RepID=A0A9W9R1S7_PENBR|nr:CAZyme family [Penicillium brevicompactum]